MQKNRVFGSFARRYVVALGVALWLLVVVYALIKNPSTSNSTKEMGVMRADMEALLSNGGVVVYRNENAKFGGALLSVLIRTDSWSPQLRDRDIETLINIGWQQRQLNHFSLCKNGILLEIQEDVGDYRNVSTVLISMRYNPTTVSACK